MTSIRAYLLSLLLIGFLPAATAQEENDEVDVMDDTLELPEGMQENTDSMIAELNMSNYFKLDTTSQLANINPYFEKAVYADRLKRIPNIMEMTHNDIVQKYIDQYTGRLRRSVSYMLGASNFYMPILEEALTYHQVPLELKYLPVIESAFNPKARSRAGAVGLWQFMTATAKQYDLEINSLVDERCDPIKASYAAARYLKDLYDVFNDWTLVIAAYNCGPNNINKAIHRAGGEKNYWKIYPYLPRETRGYVPAFIAANYVMNYYSDHNILPMRANIPTNTDTIIVSHDVKMDRISEICGIDKDVLKALNPQYKTNLIPGYKMKCIIRLPQKELLTYIDHQDSIIGDALLTEKEAEKLEEEAIATAQEETVQKKTTTRSRSRSSSGSRTVTVRRGQTLSEIAKRNHTTVANLRRLNRISGSNIQAGKKIRIR